MKLNVKNQINRIVIVAYRLPFKVVVEDNKKVLLQNSGGLVSAMLALSNKMKSRLKDQTNNKILWFGVSDQTKAEFDEVADQNTNFEVYPVNILEKDQKENYEGFCNDTLWPLFHYFPMYTIFEEKYFDSYRKVNELFFKALKSNIKTNDLIWVHDYQLMILPSLMRKDNKNLTIGFFLHIPFPAYEIFKLLYKNWRDLIIEGLLAADLIGFHTNDYTSNFLKTVSRLTGYENLYRKISTKERLIKIDTFPIGIDYEKFSKETKTKSTQSLVDEFSPFIEDKKLIFSVDRLDYTKGLLTRLKGFRLFLERYPKWLNKVIYNMVVVPSRDNIPRYQEMRREIEYLVGNINGEYGNLQWMPIIYQFKSLTFNELITSYSISHVGLITPLRDGMNLVAKEYIATQVDNNGILILSEMAGAAAELSEAIIVNPYDQIELADAIDFALRMSKKEKIKRNSKMKKRIKDYNVFSWAFDFINQLYRIKDDQKFLEMKVITPQIETAIFEDYRKSQKRLIFLDYDGTLVPFSKDPLLALPDRGLLKIVAGLSGNPKNEVTIISGRKKDFLEKAFKNVNVNLIAEHGALLKYKGRSWIESVHKNQDSGWKKEISSILQKYTEKCYGSFIETKEFALVWHYRNSEPDSAFQFVQEIKEEIGEFIKHYKDLQLLDGNKVLEVKIYGFDKGTSVVKLMNEFQNDFILAIGDDVTDEYMFKALPEYAISIKTGLSQSNARYNIPKQQDVVTFLKSLSKYEYNS